MRLSLKPTALRFVAAAALAGRRTLVFILFLAVWLAGASARSQQEKTISNNPVPVFHSTSRLVTVNVVVTDRNGHPLEGLRSDDFQVFDNGRRQKVAFFHASAQARSGATSRLATRPGEYSNRALQLGEAPQPVTVILFDTIYSGYYGGEQQRKHNWQSQAYGLRAIRTFLRQLQPDDKVGIYVLNRQGLKIVNDPQRPAAELLAAITRYDEKHQKSSARQESAPSRDDSAPSELDRFLEGRDNALPMNPCDPERFPLMIAGLQEIARGMSGMNARKSVIWVTDELPPLLTSDDPLVDLGNDPCLGLTGSPLLLEMPATPPGSGRLGQQTGRAASPDSSFQRRLPMRGDDRLLNTDDQLDLLLRLLDREGIAIYPVSAEGLQTFDLEWQRQIQAYALPYVQPMNNSQANIVTHERMMRLASRTGGRPFFDRNDLETGLRRALNDSEYTYELAYYPDHDRWKGDWHKIEVKLDQPGVNVLARGGYYAFPEPRLLPPKARKQFLSEVAASPLQASEIQMTVKLGSVAEPSRAGLKAQVDLEPQKLFVNQVGGNWTSDFEILFFQLTAENKILDVTTQNVAVELKPDEFEKALQNGINTVEELKLMPGASLLYVIAHDKRNDSVGSIRIPLAEYLASLNR